jgi:hypothetical protein
MRTASPAGVVSSGISGKIISWIVGKNGMEIGGILKKGEKKTSALLSWRIIFLGKKNNSFMENGLILHCIITAFENEEYVVKRPAFPTSRKLCSDFNKKGRHSRR